MKNKQTESGNQGLPPQITEEQFKTALTKDLETLAALINFLRSEPRALDAISEIAYQVAENHRTVKAAQLIESN